MTFFVETDWTPYRHGVWRREGRFLKLIIDTTDKIWLLSDLLPPEIHIDSVDRSSLQYKGLTADKTVVSVIVDGWNSYTVPKESNKPKVKGSMMFSGTATIKIGEITVKLEKGSIEFETEAQDDGTVKLPFEIIG